MDMHNTARAASSRPSGLDILQIVQDKERLFSTAMALLKKVSKMRYDSDEGILVFMNTALLNRGHDIMENLTRISPTSAFHARLLSQYAAQEDKRALRDLSKEAPENQHGRKYTIQAGFKKAREILDILAQDHDDLIRAAARDLKGAA